MPDFNIKPTHKPIKTYYAELEKYAQLGEENEGTVRTAFQAFRSTSTTRTAQTAVRTSLIGH